MHTDNGAFRHIRMFGADLFHGSGRKTMAGAVDDVVGASHDEDISILVHHPGIGGLVVTRKLVEAGLAESLIGIPEADEAAGRQRQLDDDIAERAARHRLA